MMLSLLYLGGGAYLMYLLFYYRELITLWSDTEEDFFVYVIYMGSMILVKSCKFIFYAYELILWSDLSINPREYNLMFRLWFKMALAITEILSFSATMIILLKSELGWSLL